MEEHNVITVGEYYLLKNYGFTSSIYHYFTIIRKKYKRTSGNTTTLHNYLKSKHANKLETETENTGGMDKFVTRDIPVSIYSLSFSLIFLYFNKY
jgi:hypothetical protein